MSSLLKYRCQIDTHNYKSCNMAIRFKAVPDRAFCIVEYLLSPTARFSS